jgi:hypothetical protein
VHGPSDKLILSEPKQRQGDYVFSAQTAGEYRFCLHNPAYSIASTSEKMVDIEIGIENEARSASLPQRPAGTTPEQHTALEEAVFKVSSQLSTINRMQKYFRTRENRNFSTVRSTEGRILRFSLVEVGMMVGMAGLQVVVVRFFFQGARKGRCGVELRARSCLERVWLTDGGAQAMCEMSTVRGDGSATPGKCDKMGTERIGRASGSTQDSGPVRKNGVQIPGQTPFD